MRTSKDVPKMLSLTKDMALAVSGFKCVVVAAAVAVVVVIVAASKSSSTIEWRTKIEERARWSGKRDLERKER